MALIACPECGKDVSDQALMCPHCGYSARLAARTYEYRSETTVLGLPLVHVILGQGRPGGPKVAHGIIAVGPVAVGVVAVGGVAIGGLALGGLTIGLVALGGMAIGLGLAAGGLAIGTVAVGGGAIGYYALGGGAWGVHALGGNASDPGAVEFFRRYLGRGVR